jgi:hypothetical protein
MTPEAYENWWQTIGINLSHKDACNAAYKLGITDGAAQAAPSKEVIVYAIPCAHTSRIFEIYGPDGMACFDFRILDGHHRVVYDTKNRGYGSATLALRDALNIGLDWDGIEGEA